MKRPDKIKGCPWCGGQVRFGYIANDPEMGPATYCCLEDGCNWNENDVAVSIGPDTEQRCKEIEEYESAEIARYPEWAAECAAQIKVGDSVLWYYEGGSAESGPTGKLETDGGIVEVLQNDGSLVVRHGPDDEDVLVVQRSWLVDPSDYETPAYLGDT